MQPAALGVSCQGSPGFDWPFVLPRGLSSLTGGPDADSLTILDHISPHTPGAPHGSAYPQYCSPILKGFYDLDENRRP